MLFEQTLFDFSIQLDAAVLQFQNQKLVQKLETQKIEIINLEEKIGKLKEKLLPYGDIVTVVNSSWEVVITVKCL